MFVIASGRCTEVPLYLEIVVEKCLIKVLRKVFKYVTLGPYPRRGNFVNLNCMRNSARV